MRGKLGALWPPILIAAIFLIGWQLLVVVQDLKPYLLPAPSLIFSTFTGSIDLMFSAAIYTGDPPDVDEIVEVLETRLPKPSARQKAALDAKRADLITRDQYAILRAVRTNDRILVTGGPGTGKTWLALEHARQETLRGAKVALLCYNRGLAVHLRRRASEWPEDERPALIATLHEVALD